MEDCAGETGISPVWRTDGWQDVDQELDVRVSDGIQSLESIPKCCPSRPRRCIEKIPENVIQKFLKKRQGRYTVQKAFLNIQNVRHEY
ncbi:hypothetical protein GDO81_028458 [Engystomops pustulosus]|uniref:Uncharacterized protein n=1 Tax=Engystomops pustulosus TaxID=76066 RepID=A0AAV6YL62_ENGPU|nr:hypothetical protein GDO81_028458 [Engystomops pustulosus]